ncbi:MAG: geranylgeranylglyceryl/heptaprenylglyceryl phosphate synthase [Calditrichia bacterium]
MSKDKTYQNLKQAIESRGGAFILLLDPDKLAVDNIPAAINLARDAGVDAFFVGGSFLMRENFNEFVLKVKQHAGHKPVIIFPGSLYQISPHADALLFLSLISGRNPEHLIGNQVMAAPILWKLGLEAISCGYMLIESGRTTSAEFISNSTPIPRDKPEIALAHSLAAKFMGMKTVYLEAGSGARDSVPHEMITMISSSVDIPIIVGGGIRTPEDAHAKVLAGSSIVVVGNLFEERDNYAMMHEFADAIHTRS